MWLTEALHAAHRSAACGSPKRCMRLTEALHAAHRSAACGSPKRCMWLTEALHAAHRSAHRIIIDVGPMKLNLFMKNKLCKYSFVVKEIRIYKLLQCCFYCVEMLVVVLLLVCWSAGSEALLL